MKANVFVVFLCFLFVSLAAAQAPSGFNRAEAINRIFQIPIQTLNAINNFAQNTRPLGEIIQRRRNPQFQYSQSQFTTQSLPTTSYYRSRAAKIAGLYTASDGSGFRI